LGWCDEVGLDSWTAIGFNSIIVLKC